MIARRTTRRALTTVSGIAAAGVVAAALAPPATAGPGDRPEDGKHRPTQGTLKKSSTKDSKDKLGQHDRQLLAKAETSGAKRVIVMVATQKGQADEVAKHLSASGAWIATVNDRLGYISASVLTSKVNTITAETAVLAVDLNEKIAVPRPTAESSGFQAKAAQVPPGPNTPDDNPYMPTRDTGSVTFKQANPAWDGRGITIGIIDSGVDLEHPALQTTSTGEMKIVDWVTGTHPLLEGDGSWRAMLTSVTGPTFTVAGVPGTWTAPAGTYKFNRVAEAISASSEARGDFNRDGDTTDRWGVLYDEKTHDIWVDANQDQTFSDAEKMRPFKEDRSVARFGVDNPATPIAESMPFVVEYREDVDLSPAGINGKADFVNIGVVESAHGTHVAGIAAGHSLFGGEMDGQAPGAKVVSTRACSWGGGCTAVALTDGMVDLVVNRQVDVVNMSIGGLPALNDGNNARARLYNALVNEFDVQLVISAGNSGPGINTLGDPSVATDVISVGSSVTKETWLANYGSVVSTPLTLHNYSSRGPREDGGFKPNVMAPGSAISSVPTWQPGSPVLEAGYPLPPGYAMFNGTSMASPQTAGAAALLLSAAKAQGFRPTTRQLRDSLYTSADFVRGVEAIAQGTGQVDVLGAWELLKAKPAGNNISVTAPVCTPISEFLAAPHQGTGVFNRCDAANGGQVSGKSKTYVVKATRATGPAGRAHHALRLVGNDGTFSLPTTSRPLPLGEQVDIPVKARTSKQGAHSAILEIDDPATPVVDQRVLLTVVLAKDLRAPDFGLTQTGSVERNLTKKLFVNVPEGAKALQVNLTGVTTGDQVRWIAFHPYGVPSESTSSLQCFTGFSDPKICSPTSRSYANPVPGIWELQVEARRTSPSLDNPYTLAAAVQGVSIDPETQTLAQVTPGQPSPVEWTVTNDFGPVTVMPKGGPLGSAVAGRKTIANHELQKFTVTVPAGATKLVAKIGNPSDPGADLDLFVRNAAGAVVAQSADGDSEEAVTVNAPAAGTYTVEVDGYAVPKGTTEYDYLDAFYSAALGTLDVGANAVRMARGDTADFAGSLTIHQTPAAGRQVSGEMNVVSSEGAVLGTGQVLVEAVG